MYIDGSRRGNEPIGGEVTASNQRRLPPLLKGDPVRRSAGGSRMTAAPPHHDHKRREIMKRATLILAGALLFAGTARAELRGGWTATRHKGQPGKLQLQLQHKTATTGRRWTSRP